MIHSVVKSHYIQHLKNRSEDGLQATAIHLFSLLHTQQDILDLSHSIKTVWAKNMDVLLDFLYQEVLAEVQKMQRYGIEDAFIKETLLQKYQGSIFEDAVECIFSEQGVLFSSMTLLNSTGDVTLTWEKHQDEKMKALIQEKLDKGYVFFVMEPRFKFLKMLGKKKVHIKDIESLKNRTVTLKTDQDAQHFLFEKINVKIGDDKAEEVFLSGVASVCNVPSDNYLTTRKTINVSEIMSTHTIATPRIAAG